MRHDIEWVTPAPFWNLAQQDPGPRPRFRQPAVLRFDSDSFMDELIALMEKGDPTVANRVAKPETWETPASGWVSANDASLLETLRLYQPVHGRFYISAASLVCRRIGLPERRVNAAEGEKASMVVRRLVAKPNRTFDPNNPDTFIEQAWIGDRKSGVWAPVTSGIAPGEERLPLFPVRTKGEQGRMRQVWAGLLPVASRELYEGARPADASTPPSAPPAPSPDPMADITDARRAVFAGRVMQGFISLSEAPSGATASDMRELLALAALDLVDFLQAELPAVWSAIQSQSSAGLGSKALAVYTRLGATFSGSTNWRTTLLRAEAHRPALLGTGNGSGPAPVPNNMTAAQVRSAVNNLIHGGHFQREVFEALDQVPAAPPVPVGVAPVLGARAAETAEAEGAVYWLRFVYERPICEPFHDPVVSAPSRPFQLAPFFDPNAPARPLVIRLPLDTSPKGLRKFPKGVAVLMSNKLRQQLERVRNVKLSDIEDGNLNPEPSWGIGMICSLSIPIITLCAFIVLMIFLSLLNIVFWWMAWFKICLPIPVRNE